MAHAIDMFKHSYPHWHSIHTPDDYIVLSCYHIHTPQHRKFTSSSATFGNHNYVKCHQIDNHQMAQNTFCKRDQDLWWTHPQFTFTTSNVTRDKSFIIICQQTPSYMHHKVLSGDHTNQTQHRRLKAPMVTRGYQRTQLRPRTCQHMTKCNPIHTAKGYENDYNRTTTKNTEIFLEDMCQRLQNHSNCDKIHRSK